ncbi:MAG: hypothetical protein AAGF97_13005 [Planctomycetota bacterium]
MKLGVLQKSWHFAWSTVHDWVLMTINRSQTCRECDQRVAVWDEVCWNCGVARPARVPITSCIILCGVPILILVVYGLCAYCL